MVLELKHGGLKSLKAQLYTGLIAFTLNGLRRSQNRFVKLKVGISALKRHGAIQISKQLGLRSYFGLSNTQLAELFKCSKSEANRIKMNCLKEGYLRVNKRLKLLASLTNTDYRIKLAFSNPHKIRVTGNRKRGINIYEQLTDELIPLIFCKRIK